MNSIHKYDRLTYTAYSYPAQQRAPSRQKLRPWVVVCLLLAVVIMGGAYSVSVFSGRATAKNQADTPNQPASTSVAPKKLHSASAASLADMTQKINQVIGQYPGVQISVSILDLNSRQSHHYGITEGYLGASTAKLITATLFLHEVEAGRQSLSATIGGSSASYQLQQLIEQSDNDAWVALNTTLGHSALQAWASQMGLTSYDADTNIITADDIATLLSKLYQNKLLNADNTKLLLSYMQNANETEYIESAVPDGVKVYHKAGWLSDRVHDAAIIDDGKNPYVLVIFTKTNSTYDTGAGKDIFHAITQATVNTYIKN